MKQTPLFAAHQAGGATMDVLEAWMQVASYRGVDDEVAAVRAGAGIVDLSAVEALTLTSPDVRRWCNGMFTNNVKRLRPGEGNRNAMCDDRGRLQGLCDLYVIREDQVLLVLDGVDVAWFEERYRMFLLLEDIEVDSLAGEAWVLSVQGPGATGVLQTLGLPVPEGGVPEGGVPEGGVAEGGVAEVPSADGSPGLRVLRRDRTGLGGFDLVVPTSVLATTWQAALGAGASPTGLLALDALRVAAGLARWPQDGSEKSLVHELRLERQVVSFDKGCYVGQEIINRVDTRGQVNKRLCGLVMAEDALPPHGAEVLLGDTVVGTVTSTARVDGRALALGVLRKVAWPPGQPVVVRAGDREVAAVTSDLPF